MARRSTTETGDAKQGSQNASQSLLDFIINNERNLTEREVRPLAQQLARTLSLVHAHGVVHRNLKLENIHVRVDPDGAHSSTLYTALLAWRLRRQRRRRCQAILTDFTYAAVTTPFPHTATSVPSPPLVSRAGEQYSPAPELLQVRPPPHAAHPEPGMRVQPWFPYAGPPVDVWGLGVVVFTLVCGRVPFDGPTLDALREASLRSPESLSFSKRVSKDCRDLLQRMLQADPVARASLDEMLAHPWMQRVSRCPGKLSVGADVPKHAALRWPDQVNCQTFYRIAALESRNGDDAWKSLDNALGLFLRRAQ